ncbi:MAG: hypothetical protein AAF226_06595, partial [Verrucomicrobiota bacterium]
LLPTFKVGNTYRMVTTSEIRIQPEKKPSRVVQLRQQARFDAKPRVGFGAGNGVAIRGYTERLEVTIETDGKTLVYDSLDEKTHGSPMGRHLQSSVNRYVDLELNRRSRILEKKEGGPVGAATPLPGMPRFGPDELVQLINSLPQGFSPDPVRGGDEWVLKGKRSVGEMGELEFDVTYKYWGPEPYDEFTCEAITFNGYITGDISDIDNETAEKRRIDFQKSRISGKMLFDKQLGMSRYAEQQVYMVVNEPAITGEEKTSTTINQKIETKLLQVVVRK